MQTTALRLFAGLTLSACLCFAGPAAAADKPKTVIKRVKKVLKEGEEAAAPEAPVAPAGDAEEKKE